MKAQFLELDVFFAITALIGSLLLLKALFIQPIETDQVELYAKDAVTILSEQTMGSLDQTFLDDLIINAHPTEIDLDATIARQATILLINDQTDLADQLIREALQNLPIQYNVSIISNLQRYDITTSTGPTEHTISQARTLLTGLEVGKPVTGFSGSVFLSSAQTTQSAYAYFGGFVGQGNISTQIDIPVGATPTEVYIEGDIRDTFEFSINENSCGTVTVPPNVDAFTAITTHTFSSTCSSYVIDGINTVDINFSGSLESAFIGGGFIRITYLYDAPPLIEPTTQKYNFPDITGIFNLFDSFYVPGELTDIDIYIHYFSNHSENNNTVFLTIGNVTLHTDNESTTEQMIVVDTSPLDLSLFTNQTVPVRMGFGNITETISQIIPSDTVLITDVSGSMNWQIVNDYPGQRRECDDSQLLSDDTSRLSLAKCSGKNFSETILQREGNRVGLVSYQSWTESTLAQTTDLQAIFNEIGTATTGYQPEGYTCIACGIKSATDLLMQSPPEQQRFLVLMSDGVANTCYPDGILPQGCSEAEAEQQAIELAEIAHNVHNISIYTIAFGKTAGVMTLQRIAEVDNISHFYKGTDAQTLNDIYSQIAEEIIQTGEYDSQVITLEGTNNDSRLFGDSYIEYTFIPSTSNQEPGTLIITGEKQPFTDTTTCESTPDSFPLIMTPLDARIISYSGSHWTDRLFINGWEVFNLSKYGDEYHQLGDPFVIGIPKHILTQGPNIYSLLTADAPDQTTGCSPFSKLLYRASLDSTITLNQVYPKAEGCSWQVSFPTEVKTLNLPSDYSGTNTCSYTGTSILYDDEDAWQVIGFTLFSSYDIEPTGGDGILEVDFTEADLSVNIAEQEEIPYMWGPAILEVVTWQ